MLGKLDNHMQKNETEWLTFKLKYGRNQLKWIQDLNTSPQTIKILQENIWGKILEFSLSNDLKLI